MGQKILVADLLCGAGGSSTGCAEALEELGLDMDLVCVNHWDVAIETHSKNHPQARHYVQDIATVRPHILVPEGYLDLLMASPTCTHHSVARGGKPTSDQQRSDPWHIITWFTELRVKCAIIENVWEFVKWGPVNPDTGRPIKDREGEYFDAWVNTIRGLGATSIEFKKLNAANYGGATTRQRFIMIIMFDGATIAWPAMTHQKRAADGSVRPGLMPWRAAREIINWNNKGRSILGRPIPLAPKTLARILAGALKFEWPEPFIRLLFRAIDESLKFHLRRAFARRNIKTDKAKWHKQVRDYAARIRHFRIAPREFGKALRGAEAMLITLRRNANGRSVEQPIPALAANGNHVGLAEPVIVNMKGRSTASSSNAPLPTQTAHAPHLFTAEPVIVSPRHSKEGAGPQPRPVSEPLPTITAGGSQVAVAEPVIMNGRKGNKAKGVSSDPIPTLDTKGGVWLAEPFVLNRNGDGYGETRAHSVEDPAPTASCRGAGYLVEPFVLSQASGGSPRSTSEPFPTIVAGGQRGSGTALISPYYGSGSGETCQSVEEPLPTVTAKARFGMVMPVTHSDGSNRARDVDVDPTSTITGANRGEHALIVAQFGERPGQTPRVHDIDDPTPGICATGHINFVEGVEGTEQCDILFRMLEPPELAAAMGFVGYQFAGTKTQQVKQIGNAVSVEMMKAIVKTLFASRAPRMTSTISEEAA